jgi:hypothetical protein
MGRTKKYTTEEQVKEAKNEATKRYYTRNKAVIDAKAREKYQKKKEPIGKSS